MNNKEIYKKTLCFSIRRLLWDILALIAVCALCVGGYFIADKTTDKGWIGLVIGGVIAVAVLFVYLRWVSYSYKAGQIAMMTRGVTENKLPDDVLGEGKRIVKERFMTVAAYFAATKIIKGIFSQLGRAITSAGEAIGGDTGSAVGSTISSIIDTIIRYLCDCCLGWVFFRKEEKASKATCEGAVLFFKHGKTFVKNMGRVFGMGLASLIAIGGIFGGVFYLIASGYPAAFENLFREITESATELPGWLNNPATLMIASAVLFGVIVWSMIHSVFIRPFVLVGVLRNYIQSGINDMPTEESFNMLDSKSDKFRQLHEEAA